MVDVGTYDVDLGGGKHVMVVGDADIYRDDTGVLKRGKWTPEPDTLGTESTVYLWSVKEDLTIRASKYPAGYRIEYKEKYVEFLFAGNTFKPVNIANLVPIHRGFRWTIGDGSTYELTISRGKVKEVIRSVTKRNKLNFIINSNVANIGKQFDRFQILDLTANDSLGKVLTVTDNIYKSNDSIFFQAVIDTAGALFPITVDPSIVDSTLTTTTMTGHIYKKNDASYAATRDAVNGEYADNTDFKIGQDGDEAKYYLWRAMVSFKNYSIPAGMIWDSAKIKLKGVTNASTTDFDILVISSYATKFDTTAYSKFNGWAASGAYSGVKSLIQTWNTVSYSADYNNWLKFNSRGIDTLKAHNTASDSVKLALISSRDSSNIEASENEYVGFTSAQAGDATKPQLWIWYSPLTYSCSLSVGSRYDTLNVHTFATDTTDVDSIRTFRISGADSIWMPPTKTTLNSLIGGFSANTKYFIFNRIYSGASADSSRSNLDTIYTRPDTGTFLFVTYTSTSITIQPKVGPQNPATTKLSVHDSSASLEYGHRLYVTLASDTSATERFYTTTQWSSFEISGFLRGQTGTFGVRAQNEDSTYKSAWEYGSFLIPAGFDSAQFTGIDTNKIKVVFDCDTFATGWTLKPFIYSGTDT
ncbi:MAG: hypothetical protein KKH70_20780, partial [Gammaproteobacteria bacterium]|nr:hypothetical protein [Gammaproteobacteria bacterium]MBU2395778.1 hypothetical protein [Gammaproteobacteria bacterium]